MSQLVRTRMAPSPTGEYHVGHLATLLKNYAFAKRNHGQFILRIEDTDRERFVEGAADKIMSVVRKFGLDWDEGPDKGGPFGPYVQSEKLPVYQEKAEELVAMGKAYYCFCSKERLAEVRSEQMANKKPPKYDRHCRELSRDEVENRLKAGEKAVIRLKVPDNQPIIFHDLIRGSIEINSNEVDDQVLLKSDGFPTYHLGVVVDDHQMKITHILRGEEWISSTPKHILLYQAFNWEIPIYAHIPVFLDPSGKGKMSKRRGSVSVQSFLDQGFLPSALLNFLMILGWTTHDQREILSLAEYVQEFDPEKISAKSVVFDLDKLRWLNGVYIRQLKDQDLTDKLHPFLPSDFPIELLPKVLPLVKERLVTLADLEDLTAFFYQPIKIDKTILLKKSDSHQVSEQLTLTADELDKLDDISWTAQKLEEQIRSLQENNDWSKKQYFMMLRVATTGRTTTPPLFETLEVLGKNETIHRLTGARQTIG